ncbi:hypothetical protein BGX34_005240 [Mortierella sp. NVP85]|nr:hypothetical protein BGX34_005240 [Mortierella sp. NVP85]
MDEGRSRVRLHWKTTNGMFNAEDAVNQDVQGLSPLDERILMRCVAEEDEEGVNQGVNPPPFTPFKVFLKRIFEPDEEGEDVVKR